MTFVSLRYESTSRQWLLAQALLVSCIPISAWVVTPPVFVPRNPMPPHHPFFPDEPMGARNRGLYGRIGQGEPFVQLMQDWKPSVGPFFNSPEPPAWAEPSNDHYRAAESMTSSPPYYNEHQRQQPLGPNSWGNSANGSYGNAMSPTGLLPGRDVRTHSSNGESWDSQRHNKSPWPESPSQFWPDSRGNPANSRQWMDGMPGNRYEMPPNRMEEPPQGYGYGHRRTFDPRSPLGFQSNYPRSRWQRPEEPMFNEVPWQPPRYESQYTSMGADEPWSSPWNGGRQNGETSLWESPQSSSSSSFGSGSSFSQPGAYDPNSFGRSTRSQPSAQYENKSGNSSSNVIEPEFYVESERNKRQTGREPTAFTQRTVAPTNGVVGMPSPFRSYLDTLSPRSLSAGRWKGPNFMPYKGPQH